MPTILTPGMPILCRLGPAMGAGRVMGDMHLFLELGVVVRGRERRNNGAGWFTLGPGQAWARAASSRRWA